ncbi:hypothetical protein SO802_012882 [Lithocarpus litseifolius]|uniref:Uncharacterized protein n=1 Tax=Lithocarpus litseifolius TaxID=425828 RepID=A0AAW2D4R6_9ROSI
MYLSMGSGGIESGFCDISISGGGGFGSGSGFGLSTNIELCSTKSKGRPPSLAIVPPKSLGMQLALDLLCLQLDAFVPLTANCSIGFLQITIRSQSDNFQLAEPSVLPVMPSSKLLPEMEVEDNSKRAQLFHGMQNLPLSSQIEKLKARIDMIGAACEIAEKMLADMRKAYLFGIRQGLTIAPTLDKGDQRQITPALPLHMVDVITVGNGVQIFADASGNNQSLVEVCVFFNCQKLFKQASAPQLIGRSAASPSATTATSFDNTTTSPLQCVNSPRSGTNMMNTISSSTFPSAAAAETTAAATKAETDATTSASAAATP